jgi:hypothetical protein
MNIYKNLPPKWETSYNCGEMNKLSVFLSEYPMGSHINTGSTCIVYNSIDGSNVIKVCTKTIEYFKHFKKTKSIDFQKIANETFKNYFAPIDKILYDDPYYFVYVQKKLKILDFSEINENVFNRIMDIIKNMFKNGIITPDVISSNFGWCGAGTDSLLLLDYHDIQPISYYKKKHKWSKQVRCLMEFASLALYGKTFESHTGESLTKWKDENYMKSNNFGSKYFPKKYVDIFMSIYLCRV